MKPERIEVWHDVEGGTLLAEADISEARDPLQSTLNVIQGAIGLFGKLPLRVLTIHGSQAGARLITTQHFEAT